MLKNKIEEYKRLAIQWSKRYNLLGRNLSFDKMIDQSKIMFNKIMPSIDIDLNKSIRIVDVGSGVGFPGIAWGIEADMKDINIELHIVERRKTACTFLEYCKHSLSLNNTHIHEKDIKKFNMKDVDIITAQAFASLLNIAEYTFHLWSENTTGIFLKTSNPIEEVMELQTLYSADIKTIPCKYGTLIELKNLKKYTI